MEFENPTRRYKWFRPRQAARGEIGISAVNYATAQLYNDSSGPSILVVRDLRVIDESGNSRQQLYYSQTKLSINNGTKTPLMPGEAAPAGLLGTQDLPALATFDFMFADGTDVGSWIHDFPLAIIPPGWALNAQIGTLAHLLYISVVWEVVSIDELDFIY